MLKPENPLDLRDAIAYKIDQLRACLELLKLVYAALSAKYVKMHEFYGGNLKFQY